MIASWRGLAVAAAIAVVLAITVAADLGGRRSAVDRALVPGFDPDRVTELVWARAGHPAVSVVRTADGWRTRAPVDAPADPGAISNVLAALRGARWHRRGDRAPVGATLTVVAGAGRRVLGIAAPIGGTELTWIVDGDRGLLVDNWVARALDPDPLALRIRTPLGDVRRARTIVVEGGATGGPRAGRLDLRIEGTPRRLVRPIELVLAADVAAELERALGDLAIVGLPAGPAHSHDLSISIAGMESRAGGGVISVELGGSCPGAPALVALSGTQGDGCVEPATVAAIEHAIARLQQPPGAIVERHPVPFEPMRIVLADGVALDTSPPRVDGAPAEPARVVELLAALAAPAEVVALPAKPPRQRLVIADHADTAITLDLFADQVVARHGEPVALRLAPGAWQLLLRPSRELRDATLWLEEPTTITTVRIDGVTYQRGAVIGAWTRRPAGAADTPTLDALVATLSEPRAIGWLDPPVSIMHRVTLQITPPAGPATEHALGLGAPRATGCPAVVAATTLLLPATVCAQVARLAR